MQKVTKQDRKQGGCSLKFEKQLAKEAKERQRGGQGGVLLVEKIPQANQYSSPVQKIAQASKGRALRKNLRKRLKRLWKKFHKRSKGEAREIAAKKFIQTMDRFLSSQLLPGSTQLLQVGFPHTGIPENGESPGV